MKQSIAALRAVADQLEQDVRRAAQSPEDIIRQFSPPDTILSVENVVDLELAGRSDFRQYLVSMTANQLSHGIARNLELQLANRGDGMRRMTATEAMLRNAGRRCETYRATVHVLAPEQLKEMLRAAYVAGTRGR